MDQMRGVAEEALALVERLVDQPVIVLLEVSQPAVDQLRRFRRRTRGEILRLDQGGAQPPGRGVEGDPAPGDAASDDEHFEALAGQAVKRGLAVEGDGRGHGPTLPTRQP